MLYKKICFVGLAVYATLSRTTFGSIYYAYANSDPTACSTATSNDHCIFLCDKQDWKNNFSCGNAGICDITCDAKQCLKGYTVNAANAAQLNVYGPSVQNCYLGTTFHLPHSGSANFSTTASSSDPYQQMIVNAGPNTQNIHIDCSGGDGKDECQSMTINAETAEYLYINADDSELDGAPLLINCPRDSASASSCYINAWNQGTLDGVEINTKYGMPHDLMVNVDDTKNFKAVTLTCSGIDPAVTVDEKDLMDPAKNGCWNTQSPTLTPTAPTPPTTAYPTSPPATYYAYANNGDTACDGAAYNDRCVLICNKQDWKRDFDCGNAGICDIICENKQCLKDYTVMASNAGQLNVVGADVDKCYSGTTFHLPSYGSANLTSSDSARDPYQLITVNAGLNTQNIYIDCSGGDGKDECQGMIVNAETAEFLYINADNSELDGSPMVINCPQNSDYNGEYEAPCYINAWNKATIDGVEINTEYGIPHDVWINVDDAKNFKDLSLTCSVIDSNAIIGANDLFDSTNNVCWNTRTPTKSPSKYPTIYPTIYPSITPTLPTLNPTLNPTLTPTNYPTLHPSKYPTKAPSTSPSIPTDYPSISPSRYPTKYPSISPSEYPTEQPSIEPSKYPTIYPSITPTLPTLNPTLNPTLAPTNYPTLQPSKSPTKAPSTSPSIPTDYPSISPSKYPAQQPVVSPSMSPATVSSAIPTTSPTKTPTKVPTRSPTNYEYLQITDPPISLGIDTTEQVSNGNTSPDQNNRLSGLQLDGNLIISIILMIAGTLFCIIGCCMYYQRLNQGRTVLRKFSEAVIEIKANRFSHVQNRNKGNNGEGRTVQRVLSGSQFDVVNIKMEGHDDNKDTDDDDIVNIKMKSHSNVVPYDSEDIDILPGANPFEDPNVLPVLNEGEPKQPGENQDDDPVAFTEQDIDMLIRTKHHNIDEMIRNDPEVIDDATPGTSDGNGDYGDIMGDVTLGGSVDNDTVQ